MATYNIEGDDAEVIITSMKKIVLKVGENSITLDSSGVTIQATNINETANLQYQLKCVQAETQADASIKLQSSMVDVAAG